MDKVCTKNNRLQVYQIILLRTKNENSIVVFRIVRENVFQRGNIFLYNTLCITRINIR